MKYFIVWLSLLFSMVSFAAEKVVPSIELNGLDKYPNQNLSVFYVSGRPAGFGTFGHILHTHKIWNKVASVKINSDGSVEIPSVKVVNTHGVAFNYLVFVVHAENQKHVRLVNTDATCPAQPNVESFASEKEHCASFSAYEFNYRKQLYKSVRQLKPESDGVIRLKI